MAVIIDGDFNCPYSYLASQRADPGQHYPGRGTGARFTLTASAQRHLPDMASSASFYQRL